MYYERFTLEVFDFVLHTVHCVLLDGKVNLFSKAVFILFIETYEKEQNTIDNLKTQS